MVICRPGPALTVLPPRPPSFPPPHAQADGGLLFPWQATCPASILPFGVAGRLSRLRGADSLQQLGGQHHILQSPGRNFYPALCVSPMPGRVLNAVLVCPHGILAITLSERGHPFYMSKANLREMTSQSSPLKSGPKIRSRGRWEGGSGWGIHVNPWLIHVNV